MRFLSQIHPSNFLRVIRDIDDEAAVEPVCLTGSEYRPAIILFVATFCLLFANYLSYPSSFRKFFMVLSQFTGHAPGALYFKLTNTTFSKLAIHAWWCLSLCIGYMVIPFFVIKFVLRDSICNYGLGFSGLLSHIKWYILLTAPILVGTVLLSFRQDFVSYYPFYRMANRSWTDLLFWEGIYLTQFVFVEFFFRGFLLHGCWRAFGSNAIFVMCIPYVMIHITKPWIEAVWSMFFGILIGVLVLRSRSIWGAVIVHCMMALSMDLMALLQKGGLPTKWLP